jgi:FkbM family methyltransferase
VGQQSLLTKTRWHQAVINAKEFWYGKKGEPIQYGRHRLRYIPGTRPVRLSYVDSPDVIVRNDARQLQFFVEKVRSGDFVLDIGGNVGQYAVLFASLVGSAGKVVTFEPDPSHREILRRNLALNRFDSMVRVEALALSDSRGSHLFFSRKDQMSSLVKSGLGTNAASPDVFEHVVETERLDDYLETNGLGFPQWVKLDTEGAEINILRGAQKLLNSKATIVCELHPYTWDEFETSYEELVTLIKASDRKMNYLDEQYRIEDGPRHATVIIS